VKPATFDPSDTPEVGEPVAKAGIGIIRRGRRFLVRMRQPGTVYAGYWEFPGGKCEPDEPPASAVERECHEETGLRVVVTRLRHHTRYKYPHGLVELHFYDCILQEPEAEPAPETGFCWVDANELSTLQFPEANELVVEELAHDFRSIPE
jgi:8-oxo-dGTP diphosphatase